MPQLCGESLVSFILGGNHYNFRTETFNPVKNIEGKQKIKDFVESIKMFMTVITTNDSTIHMGIAESAESVILRNRPKGISTCLHTAAAYVTKEGRRFVLTAPAVKMAQIFKKTLGLKGRESRNPKTEFLAIENSSVEMYDFCEKYDLFDMCVEPFCVNIEELAEVMQDYIKF